MFDVDLCEMRVLTCVCVYVCMYVCVDDVCVCMCVRVLIWRV